MRIERWVLTLPLRIRSLFRRNDVERELDDELRDHIERQTAANIAAGMLPDIARTSALREFGGVERRKEEVRATRGVSFVEHLVQDLKYAIRGLRRSPGFTTTIVLTLGLGIGVSAAAFSLVNRLVLHPLPFAAEDRLVLVFMHDAKSDVSMSPSAASVGEWQKSAKSFDAMAIIGRNWFLLTDSTHALETSGSDVSPALLSMLDIVPVAGRNLVASDTVAGAPRVAMLGELVWRREFGGRPDVIGRNILLNDTSVTIVGVAPTKLNALQIYSQVDLWTPLSPGRALMMRRSAGMNVLARMRPGVTVADAQRELQDLDDRVRHDAGRPPRTAESPVVRLTRPSDFLGAELHIGLWVVFGATGLVLLIACANVANLQLVRTTRRARELAVRRAFGASTTRLARQLIIESGVLTLLGTGVGVLVGSSALHALVALRPEQMRQLMVVRFDLPAVGFAMAAAMLASLVFGITSLWRHEDASLAEGLRASGTHTTRRRWLQPAVVCGEMALSLVLLTGAGLLVRSFVRLQRADQGYEPKGLIEFGVTLRGAHFPDSLARSEFWRQFIPRVQAIPGVTAIAVPSSLPSQPGLLEADVEVEGRQMAPGEGHIWLVESRVSSGYFRVLQSRIIEGRVFVAEDERGETDAVVVGRSLAHALWPGSSAIGKRLRVREPWRTVVGVVADQGAVTGPGTSLTSLQLFYPDAETQLHRRRGMVVRVAAGTSTKNTLVNITSALRSIDRTIPVTLAKGEVAILNEERARPRFVTTILTSFAALALFLACFGLYGVISYAVSQRVREIGVRMALGAQSTDVTRLVVGNGFRLTLIGAGIGMTGSMAASRVLRGMLYGVTPLDPLVFVLMPVLMIAVALLASYLPSRRAARADPMEALRAE